MARPLTKRDCNGATYKRPFRVEAQIDEMMQVPHADLRTRLLSPNRNDPGYLSSECLVHLVREGRISGNQQLMNTVLPVLLGRCETNLQITVSDGGVMDAASLRQNILENLTDLFVTDGNDDFPNELDFYECRFNMAFRALRIDLVRQDERRRRRSIVLTKPLPVNATNEPESDEDILARLSERARVLPTQEWTVFGEEIGKAINNLPDDEREAVGLVCMLGYKVESEDPKEETAATKCKCTGRTIRNRLTRAAEKLSRFKEDL